MFEQYFVGAKSVRYQVGPRYVSERDGDVEYVDRPMRLEDAEFWGVYRQEPCKTLTWIKDFPSKEMAMDFVQDTVGARQTGCDVCV